MIYGKFEAALSYLRDLLLGELECLFVACKNPEHMGEEVKKGRPHKWVANVRQQG